MKHECLTGCGRLTSDFLCSGCLAEVTAALRELIGTETEPGLIRELETTLARLHKLGAGAGAVSGSATTSLPYHEAAAEARWVLANTITTWARDVHEHNPHLLPPAGTVAGAAAWLVGLPGLIALHPAADELWDEITHAVALARRIIDRPADRIYAGPCEAPGPDGKCPDHLYARLGADRVVCATCGTEHDVAERRTWMIDYAADLRVTATVALSWTRLLLDKAIPPGTWRSWLSRRRLLAHGTDRQGRPVYRFGDVRDLVTEHISRPRHGRSGLRIA